MWEGNEGEGGGEGRREGRAEGEDGGEREDMGVRQKEGEKSIVYAYNIASQVNGFPPH